MLQPVKSFLLVILLITVVSAGVYVAFNRGLIKSKYLTQLTSKLNQLNKNVNPQDLENLSLSAKKQSQTLMERGGVVLGESREFIDTQVKESENKEPLHNKALEYARYIYCKQVVEDFEKIKK